MEGNIFSKNLTLLRKQRGLRAEHLAKIMEVSEEDIVGWELGVNKPTTEQYIKLAKFFEVEVVDMVNEEIVLQQNNMVSPRKVTENKQSVHPQIRTAEPRKPIENNNYQKENVVGENNKHKNFNVLKTIMMVVLIFSFISFAFTVFDSYFFSFTMFNLLIPERFSVTSFFAWLIFLIVLYLIVDSIIVLSSKKLRCSGYGGISNILNLVLNITCLILWIMVLIFNNVLSVGFTGVWLIIAFLVNSVISSVILALNRKKSENDENSQKNTNKIDVRIPLDKKFLVVKIITLVVASITLISAILVQSLMLFDQEYIIYSTILDFATKSEFDLNNIFALIILISLLWTIIDCILLLSLKATRTEKYLNFSKKLQIVSSILCLITTIIYFFFTSFADEIFLIYFVLFPVLVTLSFCSKVKSKNYKNEGEN